jgi:hypothetical protein
LPRATVCGVKGEILKDGIMFGGGGGGEGGEDGGGDEGGGGVTRVL